MAHLRILATNRYTASTTALTPSSEATALPVERSQDPDRTAVWRSLTQTGVQTIDMDLGSSLACDSVAVANVKLVGAGSLLLYRGATLGSETTLVATLPAQDRDTRTAFAFFASVSSRYWRLKWTNPGAANDYAELGFATLGPYLELSRNVRVPAALQRVDPSVIATSVDGQATHTRRTKYFAGQWDLGEVPEADLDDLRELFDGLGVHTPYFVVLDTSLAWTCWLQRFAGPLGLGLAVMAGRYDVAIPWEEVR